MPVKTFTAGSVLTASDTNTYLNNGGLVFVKQVTIGSGVSSVNVTACFDSTYDVYRVVWANVTCTSNGSAMTYKLLVGTTATTVGFYGNTYYVINAAAGGLTNANRVNTAYGECGNVTTAYKNSGYVEIHQPNLATATMSTFSLTDDNYFRFGTDILRNSTQYDGFQLAPFGGTMTGGTVTVYGYRKA